MLNGLLNRLGLPQQPFLDSLGQAMPSLIGVAVWHGVGYYTIIFIAGLQAIPYDLYEAGKLDGAAGAADVLAGWAGESDRFAERRRPYLLYPS